MTFTFGPTEVSVTRSGSSETQIRPVFYVNSENMNNPILLRDSFDGRLYIGMIVNCTGQTIYSQGDGVFSSSGNESTFSLRNNKFATYSQSSQSYQIQTTPPQS